MQSLAALLQGEMDRQEKKSIFLHFLQGDQGDEIIDALLQIVVNMAPANNNSNQITQDVEMGNNFVLSANVNSFVNIEDYEGTTENSNNQNKRPLSPNNNAQPRKAQRTLQAEESDESEPNSDEEQDLNNSDEIEQEQEQEQDLNNTDQIEQEQDLNNIDQIEQEQEQDLNNTDQIEQEQDLNNTDQIEQEQDLNNIDQIEQEQNLNNTDQIEQEQNLNNTDQIEQEQNLNNTDQIEQANSSSIETNNRQIQLSDITPVNAHEITLLNATRTRRRTATVTYSQTTPNKSTNKRKPVPLQKGLTFSPKKAPVERQKRTPTYVIPSAQQRREAVDVEAVIPHVGNDSPSATTVATQSTINFEDSQFSRPQHPPKSVEPYSFENLKVLFPPRKVDLPHTLNETGAAAALKELLEAISGHCPIWSGFYHVISAEQRQSLTRWALSFIQYLTLEKSVEISQQLKTESNEKAKHYRTAKSGVKRGLQNLFGIALATWNFLQYKKENPSVTYHDLIQAERKKMEEQNGKLSTSTEDAFWISWILSSHPVLFLIFASQVVYLGITEVKKFWCGKAPKKDSSYTHDESQQFKKNLLYLYYSYPAGCISTADKPVADFLFEYHPTNLETLSDSVESKFLSQLTHEEIGLGWLKEFVDHVYDNKVEIEKKFYEKALSFCAISTTLEEQVVDGIPEEERIKAPRKIHGIPIAVLFQYDFVWHYWFMKSTPFADLFKFLSDKVFELDNANLNDQAAGDVCKYDEETIKEVNIRISTHLEKQPIVTSEKICWDREVLTVQISSMWIVVFLNIYAAEISLLDVRAPPMVSHSSDSLPSGSPFTGYKFHAVGSLPVTYLVFQTLFTALGMDSTTDHNILSKVDFSSVEIRFGMDGRVYRHVEIEGDSCNLLLSGANLKKWEFSLGGSLKGWTDMMKKHPNLEGAVSSISRDTTKQYLDLQNYLGENSFKDVTNYQAPGELHLIHEFTPHQVSSEGYSICLAWNYRLREKMGYLYLKNRYFNYLVAEQYFLHSVAFEEYIEHVNEVDCTFVQWVLNRISRTLGKLVEEERTLKWILNDEPTNASSTPAEKTSFFGLGFSTKVLQQEDHGSAAVCDMCGFKPAVVTFYCRPCDKAFCHKHIRGHLQVCEDTEPIQSTIFVMGSRTAFDFFTGADEAWAKNPIVKPLTE